MGIRGSQERLDGIPKDEKGLIRGAESHVNQYQSLQEIRSEYRRRYKDTKVDPTNLLNRFAETEPNRVIEGRPLATLCPTAHERELITAD